MLFAVVWSIRGHGRVCPSIPCPYLHVLLVNHALLSPSLRSLGDPLLRQAFNGLDKSTSLGMPGRLCIPTLGRAIDLASLVDHMLVLMEMFQLCQTKWAKSAHGQKKRRLRDASQEIPYTGCPQILHQVLLLLGRSLRADAWEGGNWTRIRGRQKIQPLH